MSLEVSNFSINIKFNKSAQEFSIVKVDMPLERSRCQMWPITVLRKNDNSSQDVVEKIY